MNTQQVLSNLSFGKVDAESDDKLSNCFIGTDLLKQALQTRHTLLIGGKGSGKSAIFRLLSNDSFRLSQLLSSNYTEVYSIPAYGINSDEYLTYAEIQEINPKTIDDFKYFWQLYFGLKTATTIANCPRMQSRVSSSHSDSLKKNYQSILNILNEVGLFHQSKYLTRVHKKISELFVDTSSSQGITIADRSRVLTSSYKGKTALNIISLLDLIDKVLKETNCIVWILVDQIDLLYLDDIERRNKAITGLVQLLIEYSNRFVNINLKVFLRTDIYKNLQIVNKSHLITLTVELKWTENLLLKLLIARAVHDRNLRLYCEDKLKENLEVNRIISISDDIVIKIFDILFYDNKKETIKKIIPTYSWVLKQIVDGMGFLYPREFIHFGNQAVLKQKEINKNSYFLESEIGVQNSSLISFRAIKAALFEVSKYRVDTYLYAEFPHLTRHFDQFKGKEKDKFTREELHEMFSNLLPNGNDAIMSIYETGLLRPLGHKNPNASKKFVIPPLYRSGLGIVNRRNRNMKKLN